MAVEVVVHHASWKELPEEMHAPAQQAMRSVGTQKQPNQHPSVKPLGGSKYPGSFRLPVGRWRILFVHFPDERTVAFTTAFQKKRESDYLQAIERHDSRVAANE